MECMAQKDKNTEHDIEKGLCISEEEVQMKSPFSSIKHKAQLLFKFKGYSLVKSDVSLVGDASNFGNVNVEAMKSVIKKGQESKEIGEENDKKEVGKERKSMGNKKAQKPPRPPKGPIMDAADKNFIRELVKLAKLKCEKVEKMRALKKMKASKGVSSYTSIFVMVLSIILCIFVFYQGMSSQRTPTYFERSEMVVGGMEGSLMSMKLFGNPSSSIPNRPNSRSPFMMQQVAGLDKEKLKRFLGIYRLC